MNLGLVLMNFGLAAMNGFIAYHNFGLEKYGLGMFNAWACGFCFAVGVCVAMNEMLK